MNCFNHQDVPAIGMCKSCYKGLCRECASVLDNGIACKGDCEQRVIMINRMVDANSKTLSATRHHVKYSGYLSIVVGIGFLVFAAMSYKEMPDYSLHFMWGFFGLATIVTGFFRLSRKGRYPDTEQ